MDVRIGLVGAGWMGKSHTSSFVNALMLFGPESGKPVFEIVSDVSDEAARAAVEKLGYARYTTDWNEVVTDPNVDVVDIATPNYLHYEIAKAALENGKHVYSEKPLTLSYEESAELAKLAKEKGVVNYVGFNNVMNPATHYIKELISSGQLGTIMRFSGTYDQDMLLDEELPITWRHINKFSGSGSLGDLGSHLISVSQYLLGDIENVNALSKTFITKRPIAPGSPELAQVENDDTISVLATYENGAIGTLSSSRVATGRKNYLAYEIQGTKGAVHYSLEKLNEVNVYFTSDEEVNRGYRTVFLGPNHKGFKALNPATGIAIGFNDIKILEVHELLSAVANGTEYICDFEFGSRVDQTINAILKSVSVQKWIKVKDKEEVPL
ncbi:Gfo/Idh/MocA family oxidoreductase [Niallia sp. Man26]|uniref:Gfo/Idh/MocA family protein n=1 Tax=Niallia sp. Man26 TaxID=2912824 RepID=UPI001EDB3179|nr:Gfo/Idh/MocA family oxidoreductase [Niallia sp. Man26]UPO90756.1 Gfo/Idh/MocA family oxidoreductase [Niallia sp. Man26]